MKVKAKYIILLVTLLAAASRLSAQETYVPYGDIFAGERILAEYENSVNNEKIARMASGGIMIVGSGADARAFSAFGAGSHAGEGYAEIVNEYHRTFGDEVNIWCMPIPTESAFYTPDCAVNFVKDQRALINNMFALLDPGVGAVDIYTVLGNHANEDIYSRTDHHWLPLGAYYAARKFARVAGVPFKDLSSYDKHVIHDFVGTMYSFSKDAAVKNAPEDFIYYTPRDVTYSTTYITYGLDKSRRKVVSEGKPTEGEFFRKYPDGSGVAYCTFMGGDTKITQVVTSTHNGRKLVVLKDSFGNAVPGYLFYSFEEVHVIDCRYFTKNLVKYVKEHGITDILFANNLSHACTKATWDSYERYLVQ